MHLVVIIRKVRRERVSIGFLNQSNLPAGAAVVVFNDSQRIIAPKEHAVGVAARGSVRVVDVGLHRLAGAILCNHTGVIPRENVIINVVRIRR